MLKLDYQWEEQKNDQFIKLLLQTVDFQEMEDL